MNAASLRGLLRLAMILFYGVAGVTHLAVPDGFVAIVPDFVPYPRETVLATGLAELAGAAGLAVPRLRRWAGVMLAIYAVAVFPANIKHAVDNVTVAGLGLGWWYHLPRFALQPVLVWAALFAGNVINWPFARSLAAGRKPPRG